MARAASSSKVRQGQRVWGAGPGVLTQLTRLCLARGARGAIDVVVGETDYRSFAILYLERARRLSVKLYSTSTCEPGPLTWGLRVWLCEPRWTHSPAPPSLPAS